MEVILTEGTCLCLIMAIFFLILAFKDLTKKAISPKYQVIKQEGPRGDIPSKASDTSPSGTTTGAPAPTSAKGQYLKRYAEIELQNRERWCKEFEEQELRKYFQTKHCQYMFNQNFNAAGNGMMGYGDPYASNTMEYPRGYY